MRSLSAALLLVIPFVYSAQIPFSAQQQAPSITSTTLIDVLSADPDYTTLLSLIQKARLVPTLNRLNGSTLFAPTNDAIKGSKGRNSLWAAALAGDEAFLARDNVQEQLRQELFYHLLNYTIIDTPSEVGGGEQLKPETYKTLHYPRQPTQPPSREPPPYPPWMPIPGGTLGGEPQRLRAVRRQKHRFVGVNAFGEGGAKVVKEIQTAGNGVVVGINDVLTVPPDLATVITQHPSLAYLNSIMTQELFQMLNETSAVTLFLPTDEAWEDLHPLERRYLESKFASDDLLRILELHAVAQEGVIWSQLFENDSNLTTLHGRKLHIQIDSGKTSVSSAELVQPDVYASNGVVHTITSLLLPDGTLQLTPEKYLLALNCTSFVELLHSVQLETLVNDTEAKFTILAPQDDVLSIFARDEDLPEKGSDELRQLLQYHFLPGKWAPGKLQDSILVETALKEPGLAGEPQVVDVRMSPSSDTSKPNKISFAGASVVGEPIEVNNTIIYLVSRPLVPPVDAFKTALPNLDLSSFLAAVAGTTLPTILYTQPLTTLMIPTNDAFKRLGGLVSDYFLRGTAKQDLERLILHHAINGVEYADKLVNGTTRTYPTSEGTDVHVERSEGAAVILSGSGGWVGMSAALLPTNLLTSTGVVHVLTDVLIPRSVDLTIGKLAKAGRASTMQTLVSKADMGWVLNSTAPPEGSKWETMGLSGADLTLLCPVDEAFKDVNLTALYLDLESMQAIVEQHIIPLPSLDSDTPISFSPPVGVMSDNRPIRMADEATYTTALSTTSAYGDIMFRANAAAPGGFIVGIRNTVGTNGREDWAHVVSWGRTTAGTKAGGVILLDRLLVPYNPPWYRVYGPPVAGGIFGGLLIIGFFAGVRWVWRRDTTEATYEPIGGAITDDD